MIWYMYVVMNSTMQANQAVLIPSTNPSPPLPHPHWTGIKEFTDWPTIPQIFFNGEFVGGCDIMLQMHQSGDLVEELEKLGIRSALLDTPQEDTK